MADDIITSQEPTVTEPAIPAELAQMMELSLNNGIQPANPSPAAQTQPAAVGDPVIQPTPAAPSDPFAIFKEKYGFQAPEDVIKEIDELRVYKANPTPGEFKFENDDSKKMALAIQKGDRKAVLDIWSKQEKIETLSAAEVTKENAAEIIKMGMKVENEDLTQAEIDFQYEEQYTAPKEPKEPVQRTTETDEEFLERKEDWQERHEDWAKRVANIETKISIAAKMAKPKLEIAKSKIVLPEFDDDIDEGYVQYQKMLEARPAIEAEIQAEYKTFTPKTIETKVKFIDEANKIDFEFQHEPDGESFNKAVEMALDVNKFFDHFKTSDGKPDRQKFLRAIYLAINEEKVITSALNQSKNATIKASLPDNSSGPQRQFPQNQELSELDKMMQLSLNGHKR